MRQFRKSICLVLSLLLLASVCVVPTFAANEALPNGTEDPAKINVKFEVEQVDSAYDGLLTATDNNIYAVTVYAKANYGINVLQVPIHYDKTKFSPIMWADDNPVANGALGYDGWYTDIMDDTIYDSVNGQAWNETQMLRANGTPATSMGAAQYIPLGNENAAPMAQRAVYVDSSNEGYAAFKNGLSDNTGITYYFFNNTTNKNAYPNAYQNQLVTDWVSMITFYFMRNEGVSEAEAVGSVFGFTVAGAYGTQGALDVSGNARYMTAGYVGSEPGVNYVSNAVVEAEAPAGPAVTLSKQQINMDMDNDGVITDDFSFRALCEISNDDWNTYFADTAAAGSANAINGVGIVAADKASFDLAAAQEAAKANFADQGADTGAYKVAWTTYIQKVGDASAYFGARIDTTKDSCQDVSYVGVVAYLDAEGAQQFMFFDAAKTVDLKTNYETYRAQYEDFLNQ